MSTITAAVTAALAGRATADPRDEGAARLALTYAELLDHAAPAAKYRRALAVIDRAYPQATLLDDTDNELADALALVATALAQHSVASDLGPKLLATLASLGLTTAARVDPKQTAGGERRATSPLDELKTRRAERNAR